MRPVLDRWITAWVLIPMLAAPEATAAQAEGGLAVRGEGYVGYSTIDLDFAFGDADADGFEGGGAGSIAALIGSFYLQGDVFGDVSNFDNADPERTGGGGHIGWRDAAVGSLGVVGAINHASSNGSDTDEWRAGIEAQAFLESFTAGLDAGFFDGDASSNANGNELVYLRGIVAFYPTDRIRLDFKGGALGVGKDDPTVLLGAGGELQISDFLSAFARWEAALLDAGSTEIEEHSIVGGVRFYWGSDQPSLQSYDRERFNESCLGLRRFGRSC